MSAILTIRKKRKTIESLSFILYIIPFLAIISYLIDTFFNEGEGRLFIYLSVFIITLLPCSVLSFICLQVSRLGIYRKTRRDERLRVFSNIFCGLGMCMGLLGWSLLFNALN